MELSKAEIESFVEQMKGSIFKSHSENEGLVQGEIKENVYELLYEDIKKGIPMNPMEFQKMLMSITEKIAQYLTNEISDLPEKLAATFSFDLVTQVISTVVSKIDVKEGDSGFDPMFG